MVNPNRKSFAEHCIEHRPELMKEWHPDNKISPYDIDRSSREKVKWFCTVNSNHADWITGVENRVYTKHGCPECSRIKGRQTFRKNTLKKRGSLSDHFPKIAAELHPTLNTITADKITAGSHMKLVWQCPKRKDHVYSAIVKNRSSKNPSGCSFCKPNTSKREISLYSELKYLFEDVEWRKKYGKREVDVYIPKYNLGIEFDGGYYHKGREEYDLSKNKSMTSKGLTIMRIRDSRLDRLSETDTFFENKDSDSSIIMSFVNSLKNNIKLNSDDANNIDNYLKEGQLKNYSHAKKMIGTLPFPPFEASVAFKVPTINDEFDYNSNDGITPELIWAGSNDFMNLICKNSKCNMKYSSHAGDYVRGSRCPYCAGQKIGPYNNLKYKFPEIAKSWDYDKNYPIKPEDVHYGSRANRYWICLNNPEHLGWYATPHGRTGRGDGCLICGNIRGALKRHTTQLKERGSVETTHPDIVKSWHPDNDLKPSEITAGSSTKVKLYCLKDNNHKPFTRTLYNVTSGRSTCPKCSTKIRSKSVTNAKISTTLENWCKKNNPELLKEYETDNEYKPNEISYGSSHKVKWRCKKYPRHPIFVNAVSHRTGGESCRKCYFERQGKMAMARSVKKYGSVGRIIPNIKKWWDPDNKYKPNEVGINSHYRIKLICSNCSYKFRRGGRDLHKTILCNMCKEKLVLRS